MDKPLITRKQKCPRCCGMFGVRLQADCTICHGTGEYDQVLVEQPCYLCRHGSANYRSIYIDHEHCPACNDTGIVLANGGMLAHYGK